MGAGDADELRAFLSRPHTTLARLSAPVLLSLIAEPLTGLVDTHWVSRLGAGPLAGLGIATTALSAVLWAFNFLGIGTQTEIARARGGREPELAARVHTVATVLALALGVAVGAALLLCARPIVAALGGEGDAESAATTYLRIRVLGSPAVLLTIAAFGALRGLSDMRTPLLVSVGLNALNLALDPLLIFGAGPLPALGVAGAAWASVIAQWSGALAASLAAWRQVGFAGGADRHTLRRLTLVGRDIFVRTAAITAFLLLATRAANLAGEEAGAAHQAIRQVWLLTALFLDAWATAGQSLVATLLGAREVRGARRVAVAVLVQTVLTSVALALLLAGVTAPVTAWLVPPSAAAVFRPAWLVSCATLPVNAVSFATDGIHWGAADWAWLRNSVLLATGAGSVALLGADVDAPGALTIIWTITAGWISVRAVLGLLRIWPGVGDAPLRSPLDDDEVPGDRLSARR